MPYMPKATLIFKEKLVFPDHAIMEGVIWQLPEASLERPHGLKYRTCVKSEVNHEQA